MHLNFYNTDLDVMFVEVLLVLRLRSEIMAHEFVALRLFSSDAFFLHARKGLNPFQHHI